MAVSCLPSLPFGLGCGRNASHVGIFFSFMAVLVCLLWIKRLKPSC